MMRCWITFTMPDMPDNQRICWIAWQRLFSSIIENLMIGMEPAFFEESTIEQIFPEAMYDNEAFIWRENIGGVIYEALKETGWHMHWIGSYIEELRDALAEYAE